MSFAQRLADHALRNPDFPALMTVDATVTYGHLVQDVRAWARALREQNLAPGTVVGLTVNAEIEHVVAVLALFELGVPSVSLVTREPPASRARLAQRVGVTVVLADRPEDRLPGLPAIDVAAVRAAAARPGTSPPAAMDDAKRVLYLTGSGTTGDPKIVAYSQAELELHAAAHIDFTGERMLRPAHVAYNNSKRMRLYVLWRGGTCAFADGSTDSLTSLCARLRPTWFELTAMHGIDLVAAARREGHLPSDVKVRIGGSRVPLAVRRAILAEVTPRLYVSYGTTETSMIALADPTMHDEHEAVGPPNPHVEVAILRPDGTAAAQDEVGEIRIRAPGMATGYVGDAQATARHFRDGWFVPGDLASLDARGRLVIHGRADDMMIMNTINIFPVEIERVLEAHPSVEAAAAFPLASPVHGQIPMAAVELRAGHACTAGELLAHARRILGVRAPRRVEILPALPRNVQGKVLKRELAQRYTTQGR